MSGNHMDTGFTGPVTLKWQETWYENAWQECMVRHDMNIHEHCRFLKPRINWLIMFFFIFVWRGEQDLPQEPDPEKDGGVKGDKAGAGHVNSSICCKADERGRATRRRHWKNLHVFPIFSRIWSRLQHWNARPSRGLVPSDRVTLKTWKLETKAKACWELLLVYECVWCLFILIVWSYDF